MKRWQQIGTALSLSVLALLSRADIALAQSDGNTLSILSGILVPILVLIDHLLDFWVNSVTGNTLTNPMGEEIVGWIATIIQNVTLFLAEFSTLLTGNRPS
jgi:hypothetical protein